MPPANLSISAEQNIVSIGWTKTHMESGYYVYQMRIDGNQHYEHTTQTELSLTDISNNVASNSVYLTNTTGTSYT